MNPQQATTTSQAAPAAPAAAQSALDPQVVALAKAIRSVETKGQKDPYTAKGASDEFGAYQYTTGTWAADAKSFLGKEVPLASATREQQNEVAYKKLLSLKQQGYNPGQIASIWNSGSPEWEGKVGVNKYGVKYDVPKYVDAVSTAYQGFKAGNENPILKKSPSTVGSEEKLSPNEMKDYQSAQKYGAFFPSTTGDSPLSAGLKTAGNMVPSAFNFAKGAIQTLNPIETLKKIIAVPGEFDALVKESGGVGKALKLFAGSVPEETYKALIPEAGRDIVSAGVGAVQGDSRRVDEGLQGAQRAITNDPFGQIAPFVIYGKMGAKALDKTGVTTGAEAAVDSAISKTAEPVIQGAKYAFGAPVRAVAGTAKYATSKLSGLNKDTIEQISERPGDFTPQKMGQMSRQSLGEDIGGKLTERIDALDEAGAGYSGIRQSTAPLKLDPNTLGDAIAETTGLVLKKGKFTPTAKSFIDQPADVARIQRFYDAWQPYFKKGEMTADDFLTMRTKLGKIAYNDAGLKSGDMSSVAARVRGSLNTAYRSKVEGLEDLDANFASMAKELKDLRKGLIDRDGNLLETAVNRIANAGGKGKDAFLSRLEEISPGVGLKIRQLKAIEDIQNIHKVGTYTKSAIEGGGLVGGIATGNIALIAASVLSLLLSQPEVAVRIIRTYGNSKALAQAVLQQLGKATDVVNKLPETPVALPGAFGRKSPEMVQ